MKILLCNECGIKVGEITKGKIKKGCIFVCGDCKAKETAEDVLNSTDESFDFLKNFMGMGE